MRGARHRVLAYDVADPRRRDRVRRRIARHRTDGLYSVMETHISAATRDVLLADLSEMMDHGRDRLALWTPWDGRRLTIVPAAAEEERWPDSGNWIYSYDVCESGRLRAVQRVIAARTQALQRSVYWLHDSGRGAAALVRSAAEVLDPRQDRLWVYPLHSAADLWFVVGTPAPTLPVGLPGWRRGPNDDAVKDS